MTTRRYRAYGLIIASDVELPELDAADAEDAVDVHIVIEPVVGPMPTGHGERYCEIGPDHIYFAWESMARIRVDGWRRVAVYPEPGTEDATLAFALLGPVMAAILHGRGDLVLHGSAVELDEGRAVLFVGDNGAGKSSLAAAFIRADYPLINDDVAAIFLDDQGIPYIRRGFPAMKLSKSALDAFTPMPGKLLPSPIANPAKLRLRLAASDPRPLCLDHIFLVRRGEKSAITPLAPADRLGLAMRYGYMPKLGATSPGQMVTPCHFRIGAAVAHITPASILTVPDRLEALAEIVDSLGKGIGIRDRASTSPDLPQK